jgi:hypothetical protein
MITLTLELPKTDTAINPRKYISELAQTDPDVRRIWCDTYFSWCFLEIEIRGPMMKIRANYLDPTAELITRTLLEKNQK